MLVVMRSFDRSLLRCRFPHLRSYFRGIQTCLKPEQYGLGRSLCISRCFRSGTGSADHSARLAGQQFTVAWSLRVPLCDTGGCLRRTRTRRARIVA
jgi:hypothetical protein